MKRVIALMAFKGMKRVIALMAFVARRLHPY